MAAGPPLSLAQRALLAVLALLPALAITAYLLAGDVEALTAPTWAASQPRGQYLAMALAVKGTILVGVAVSAAGLVRASRRASLAGALALAVGAFPLMLGGTGFVVLLSAVMVFAAARLATPAPTR